MKKIIASTSLVALGAASLHAAYVPGLTRQETAKSWTISGSVRGFFDDNIYTRPTHIYNTAGKLVNGRVSSFGVEVSPHAGLNLILNDSTTLGLSYTYTLRYYENRTPDADHIHQADLHLSHAFSDTAKVNLKDSFAVAQEPQVLEQQGGIISLPLRANGSNIRNFADASGTFAIGPELGMVVGYRNFYYDYSDTGAGSYSALLDRMEHIPSVDIRWTVSPETVGVLGYQYHITDYTSKDNLIPSATYYSPSLRDNTSHYVFVGVDQSFSPTLTGSLRAGAQFTDFNKLPTGNKSTVSPYVDANLTYTYREGSFAQFGVRHSRNATDIASLNNNGVPTTDQESTAVYATINHKITAKLTGILLAQFQTSDFHGGGVSGLTDMFWFINAKVAYQINTFLSAEAGYSFDRLDSDIAFRSYYRNFGFIGLKAEY